MTIRWLHLSDVHECEEYGRRRMYEKILAHAAERIQKEDALDFVFLTGDLAWGGQKAEYDALARDFITPLKGIVGAKVPLLMVPGNHDLDRECVPKPRDWIIADDKLKAMARADDTGRKHRITIASRFDNYIAFAKCGTFGGDWLRSNEGAVVRRFGEVAVVGINTAWLAQDEQDWGKLTPGADLLGVALDKVRDARLTIVLGHHPLVSFDPREQGKVRGLLERHKALYLHGHMHINDTQAIGGGVKSCLAVQAASAFQAHDDPHHRNGLCWGEADIDDGWLIMEPRLFNADRDEWKHDGDAGSEDDRVEGRDAFRLRLPGRGEVVETDAATGLPRGWEKLNLQALRAQPCNEADLLDFLDGRIPRWPVALSSAIRPRGVVADAVRLLDQARLDRSRTQVVLIQGPGGEGKSTALMQAAAAVADAGGGGWTVVHRRNPATALPPDLVTRLPEANEHCWLLVIDDADTQAEAIFANLQALGDRADLHFLLAARQTDWESQRGAEARWNKVANFDPLPLHGLDDDDARAITSAWWDLGMGKMQAGSADDAAAQLKAKAAQVTGRDADGTLLGALLELRLGDRLRQHVRDFLLPLAAIPIPATGGRLIDAYAMIAAMHAENQLYLTRPVLARALGCDLATLERQVLARLADEKVEVSDGTTLLTRHRRIAEEAVRLLRDDPQSFGVEVDAAYPKLAGAALAGFVSRLDFVPHIKDWTYDLARHFQDRPVTHLVARAVARAVFTADPDIENLTALARVLRKTEAAPEAIAVLRDNSARIAQDRGALYEWSAAAGQVGRRDLNAWLAARSLADLPGVGVDDRQTKFSLAGLGRALEMLWKAAPNPAMLSGWAACGRLGLSLPFGLDAKAKGYFTHHVTAAARAGADTGLAPDAAIEALKAAVVAAVARVPADEEREFFTRLLKSPQTYAFTALRRYYPPR